ncbi:hypothetical protein [Mesorhizobium sp. 113-3-3]|uniref:hypothetical protein n=1 Tax=Mesorhizobium sp. 113-3-3 TaxID=2744516 RepID=UPI001928DFE5|nr:hypothetical protein [Mesorhizobium sp. 113-3-3]
MNKELPLCVTACALPLPATIESTHQADPQIRYGPRPVYYLDNELIRIKFRVEGTQLGLSVGMPTH